MKILRRLLTVLAALVLFGVVCAAGLIGFVYDKETHLPRSAILTPSLCSARRLRRMARPPSRWKDG